MKRIATLLVAVIAIIMMTACKSNTNNAEAEAKRYLVLYYSQGGVTAEVAEMIKDALGADIERIEAVEPYDGTYDETIARCLQEQQDGKIPEINPIKADIDSYDVVFVGYPIWFGTYASPIADLVRTHDFDGKRVVPFCTFGSGGLESSATNLREALPKAEVAEGYGVRTIRVADAKPEIDRFLIENGYMEGTVEPLPAFGEEADVTSDEAAIFNDACGDYQYPLGTPVKVASRTIDDKPTVEYRFTALTGFGEPAQSTIYVLAAPGVKPVFTRVVR